MSTVIDTITGEEDNLKLHVGLCEQRYTQLVSKLNEVDGRLDTIETMLSEIKDSVTNQTKNTYKTYLGWSGAIIIILLGALVSHIFRQ